jgi:hypothetical protein
MSKRKPVTSSKRASGPKIVAKAQRVMRVVGSPKHHRRQSVAAAGLSESPLERLGEEGSKQNALLAENPVATLNPVAAASLQDDVGHAVSPNLNKGFDFSSATANLRAYQGKILEVSQAHMQFAFEFTQRLATLSSPVDFPAFIAEFTSRRISMFQKYSNEMAELSAIL